MGIPGLWEQLDEACAITSLRKEGDAAFKQSTGHRGLRVGVDALIWAFHADRHTNSEEDRGLNSGLKMIMQRVQIMIASNVLLVFVFDGPNKPRWKRGKYVGGGTQSTEAIRDYKRLLSIFGVPWLEAAGEAEAELAAMNAAGEIDAVLTDDVDVWLFGAKLVFRNTSGDLTGNKRLKRKASELTSSDEDEPPSTSSRTAPNNPVYKYAYTDIEEHALIDRDGMLLIALMAGGDYAPKGLKQSGIKIVLSLAQHGFAKLFADIARASLPRAEALERLAEWKESVAVALETKGTGLDRALKSLASGIRESGANWPDLQAARDYLQPATSQRRPIAWDDQIDLPGLVAFCSSKFHWSVKDIKASFQSRLYPALLVQQMRHTTLKLDQQSERWVFPGTPDNLVVSISDEKSAPSTDNTLSLRVEIDPAAFYDTYAWALPDPDPHPNLPPGAQVEPYGTWNGLVPSGRKKPSEANPVRHWIPAALVEAALPAKVANFRAKRAERQLTKSRSKSATLTPSHSRSRDRVNHIQTLLSPLGSQTPKSSAKTPTIAIGPQDTARRQLWPSSESNAWTPVPNQVRPLKKGTDKGQARGANEDMGSKMTVHSKKGRETGSTRNVPKAVQDPKQPNNRRPVERLSPDSQYRRNLVSFDPDSDSDSDFGGSYSSRREATSQKGRSDARQAVSRHSKAAQVKSTSKPAKPLEVIVLDDSD